MPLVTAIYGLADAQITLKPTATGGNGMMRMMRQEDMSTKFEATSGSDGRFELAGLPAGTFDLDAARDSRAMPARLSKPTTRSSRTRRIGSMCMSSER